MRPIERPVIAAVGLLVLCCGALAGAGCSSGRATISMDATTIAVSADDGSNSTTSSPVGEPSDRDASDDAAADPQAVAAPADFSEIEDAVERKDPCAVYEALDELSFDGTSFESMAALMERIEAMLRSSTDVVDESIRDDWATMTGAFGDLAVALGSGPDAKEAAARVFADPDYLEAQRSVDEWLDSHCG